MFEERVGVRLAVEQVDVSVENAQHHGPLPSRLRISTRLYYQRLWGLMGHKISDPAT